MRQHPHDTRQGSTRKLARTARITFLIAAGIVARTADTVWDHTSTTPREDNTATDVGSMMNVHVKTAMEACEAKVVKLCQHAHNTLTEIGRRTESANNARHVREQVRTAVWKHAGPRHATQVPYAKRRMPHNYHTRRAIMAIAASCATLTTTTLNSEVAAVMIRLTLFRAGDVEPHPGPRHDTRHNRTR
jgi:hypothetical protein